MAHERMDFVCIYGGGCPCFPYMNMRSVEESQWFTQVADIVAIGTKFDLYIVRELCHQIHQVALTMADVVEHIHSSGSSVRKQWCYMIAGLGNFHFTWEEYPDQGVD